MANRIKNQEVKLDSSKKRYYKYIKYPEIPVDISDVYIITRIGERLDLLAHRYYDDVNYWWIISKANGLNPSDIGLEPATQLRIPTDIGEVLRAFNSENLK